MGRPARRRPGPHKGGKRCERERGRGRGRGRQGRVRGRGPARHLLRRVSGRETHRVVVASARAAHGAREVGRRLDEVVLKLSVREVAVEAAAAARHEPARRRVRAVGREAQNGIHVRNGAHAERLRNVDELRNAGRERVAGSPLALAQLLSHCEPEDLFPAPVISAIGHLRDVAVGAGVKNALDANARERCEDAHVLGPLRSVADVYLVVILGPASTVFV